MGSTLDRRRAAGKLDIVNVDQCQSTLRAPPGREGAEDGNRGAEMTDEAGSTGMTAAEVADLLGVKRQTVYAYVSRGILHRRLDMDGRTSIFDRAEVEELRLGRRPEQDGEMRILVTTALTRVADEALWIRGRDVIEAIDGGARFVDLVELVWGGGDGEPWPRPEAVLPPRDGVPTPGPTIDGGPSALLEQLRILVALAAGSDPQRHDLSPRSVRAAGRRAITAMACGLRGRPADRGADHRTDGREDGSGRGDGPPPLVDRLWHNLTATEPTGARLRALDVALASLVDHGLATSTLAARVAASVRADPYSVIAAGLGVLGGALHGRATTAAHELYRTAEAEGAAAALARLQRQGIPVPGFGHAIYQTQDPRYGALMGHIVQGWSNDPRLATVFQVRDLVGQRSDAIPNVDLATGALTFLADMPASAGEAIFAVSRTSGWLAHALEEYGEKPLRFRSRARYVGPQPNR